MENSELPYPFDSKTRHVIFEKYPQFDCVSFSLEEILEEEGFTDKFESIFEQKKFNFDKSNYKMFNGAKFLVR